MSNSNFTQVKPRILKETSKGTPVLDARRTGKVIIVDKFGTHKTVEGCHFSNVDYLFYNSENNLHPIFEEYKGKKFGLKYQLTDLDRFRQEQEHEGIFLSPLLLGEIGPIDWQHMWEAEEFEADFSIKVGRCSGYGDNHIKDFIGGAACAFIMFTTPDVKYEEIKALIIHLSLLLVIDEQFDNHLWFDGFKTPMANIQQVVDKIMEVFRFEKDPEEQETDFDFPMMKPWCRYAAYIRDGLKPKCSTDEIYQRYVKSMSYYLNGMALNNSKEWIDFKCKCKTGADHRAHWDLRRADSGCESYFDAKMMAFGNQLPQHIFDSHLWQAFRKLSMDNIVLINDIISYSKELFDKEFCNALIMRHFDEKMDFVAAAESCVADANKATMDMIELERLLLERYANDENLKDLKQGLYLYKSSNLGHVRWYNYALRYQNGMVFDCVIYEDDDVMLEQLNIK